MTKTRVLKGVVIIGHGVASGRAGNQSTILLQKKYFKAQGLDLSHCFNGTINIDFAPLSIKSVKPDYYFEQVKWHQQVNAENFSLIDCQLISAGKSYDCLVYFPDRATKPDHFQPDSVLEIIGPLIPSISYGAEVELILPTTSIELYY